MTLVEKHFPWRASPSSFIRAAALADSETVKVICEKGDYLGWEGGIDTQDPIGCTPLHAAARALATNSTLSYKEKAGYLSIVRTLLQEGSNPFYVAINGKCANDYLHKAFEAIGCSQLDPD